MELLHLRISPHCRTSVPISGQPAREIAEKQARSIRYQMTIAKLPLAKGIDHFDFAGTMIDRTRVKDLPWRPLNPYRLSTGFPIQICSIVLPMRVVVS